MMISLSAWGNYVTMATYFPWVKVQNNEVGSRGCVLGLATYRTEIKREKQIRTLQSSDCTPHIYREEVACLPGQQKEWDLYTSAT